MWIDTPITDRSAAAILAVGDWLVLLLFVFTGQRDHAISGPGAVNSLLVTTLSLALAFTAAAFLLGAYRIEPGLSWAQWLGRVLTSWLVAAPLGLIVRALLKGQDSIALPFMLVVMGLGGLFVIAWRAVFFWWRQRRQRPAST